MKFSFPKTLRILKRYQYQRLTNQSRRHVGNWILIESRSNTVSVTRLGITASRKFGKAHDRNRFKRIVRESFRICRTQLPIGLDLNVRPRSNVKNAKMQDIMQEMIKLLNP